MAELRQAGPLCFWVIFATPRDFPDHIVMRRQYAVLGIIRSNNEDAFVICPPNMSDDGQWHIKTGQSEEAHSVEEIFDVLERGHA